MHVDPGTGGRAGTRRTCGTTRAGRKARSARDAKVIDRFPRSCLVSPQIIWKIVNLGGAITGGWGPRRSDWVLLRRDGALIRGHRRISCVLDQWIRWDVAVSGKEEVTGVSTERSRHDDQGRPDCSCQFPDSLRSRAPFLTVQITRPR